MTWIINDYKIPSVTLCVTSFFCDKQQSPTWQIYCLITQEKPSGNASPVPSPGKGQDLAEAAHVVFEGSRSYVTDS